MDKRKKLEKLIDQASRTPSIDVVLRLHKEAAPIADLGLTGNQIEEVSRPMRGGGLFTMSGPTEHGMSTTLSVFAQDLVRKRRAAGLADFGDVLEEPAGGVDVVNVDLR